MCLLIDSYQMFWTVPKKCCVVIPGKLTGSTELGSLWLPQLVSPWLKLITCYTLIWQTTNCVCQHWQSLGKQLAELCIPSNRSLNKKVNFCGKHTREAYSVCILTWLGNEDVCCGTIVVNWVFIGWCPFVTFSVQEDYKNWDVYPKSLYFKVGCKESSFVCVT